MKTPSMTGQESLELITQMIESTKRRYKMADGNLFLFWGYTSVFTCLLVFFLSLWTKSAWVGFFWFLLPLVGGVLSRRLKAQSTEAYVKSYTDRILSRFWLLIGLFAWVLSAICALFHYMGHPEVWSMMLIYAFLIVGIGVVANGVVLQENSMVAGGAVGTIAGAVFTGILLAGYSISWSWFLPSYVLTFTLMLIVPGHLIRRRVQREEALSNSSLYVG